MPEKSPGITVILTSYNHGNYLEESIESILNQTYRDFELIIIDDCSQDNSWDLILRFAKKDPRIKPIRHETNRQMSIPEGIELAQGKYIAIAHSDDVWIKDKLEKQINYLDNHPLVAACFTRVTLIDDAGLERFEDPRTAIFQRNNRSRYEWLKFFFFSGNALCHPSILIRKHAYNNYSLLSQGLHGLPDFCQWIRLCSHAEIFILESPLVKLRFHDDESNTSGSNLGAMQRLRTESYLVLEEFRKLSDSDFLQAFPEAKKFLIDGEMIRDFALARICLDECPDSAHRLFGLKLIYDLFQDEETRARLLRLYDYNKSKFDSDKKKFDIFNSIPREDKCSITLYADNGTGFCEKRSVQKKMYAPAGSVLRLSWTLASSFPDEQIVGLRLDPDEGVLRRCRIVSATFDTLPTEYTNNATRQSNGYDEFLTPDPQYYFKVPKGANSFSIHLQIETLSASTIQKNYAELLDSSTKNSEELKKIKNSTTWKITKPLRLILNTLKRD